MAKIGNATEARDFRTQFNNLSTNKKIAYVIVLLVLASFVVYAATAFTSSAIEYAIIGK